MQFVIFMLLLNILVFDLSASKPMFAPDVMLQQNLGVFKNSVIELKNKLAMLQARLVALKGALDGQGQYASAFDEMKKTGFGKALKSVIDGSHYGTKDEVNDALALLEVKIEELSKTITDKKKLYESLNNNAAVNRILTRFEKTLKEAKPFHFLADSLLAIIQKNNDHSETLINFLNENGSFKIIIMRLKLQVEAQKQKTAALPYASESDAVSDLKTLLTEGDKIKVQTIITKLNMFDNKIIVKNAIDSIISKDVDFVKKLTDKLKGLGLTLYHYVRLSKHLGIEESIAGPLVDDQTIKLLRDLLENENLTSNDVVSFLKALNEKKDVIKQITFDVIFNIADMIKKERAYVLAQLTKMNEMQIDVVLREVFDSVKVQIAAFVKKNIIFDHIKAELVALYNEKNEADRKAKAENFLQNYELSYQIGNIVAPVLEEIIKEETKKDTTQTRKSIMTKFLELLGLENNVGKQESTSKRTLQQLLRTIRDKTAEQIVPESLLEQVQKGRGKKTPEELELERQKKAQYDAEKQKKNMELIESTIIAYFDNYKNNDEYIFLINQMLKDNPAAKVVLSGLLSRTPQYFEFVKNYFVAHKGDVEKISALNGVIDPIIKDREIAKLKAELAELQKEKTVKTHHKKHSSKKKKQEDKESSLIESMEKALAAWRKQAILEPLPELLITNKDKITKLIISEDEKARLGKFVPNMWMQQSDGEEKEALEKIKKAIGK